MTLFDNIPARLQETGLFCCWKREQRRDKTTKVPYNPRTGGKAQSTKPDTFAPYKAALEAVQRGGYTGLGVGVFGTLGAIGIDHCLSDAGELSDMACDIMETIPSPAAPPLEWDGEIGGAADLDDLDLI